MLGSHLKQMGGAIPMGVWLYGILMGVWCAYAMMWAVLVNRRVLKVGIKVGI